MVNSLPDRQYAASHDISNNIQLVVGKLHIVCSSSDREDFDTADILSLRDLKLREDHMSRSQQRLSRSCM